MKANRPVRGEGRDVLLEVVVQPRASKTEVVGIQGEALKIRVAAPPVEGAANEALRQFLAKRLGVSRQHVVLVRGETGRRKALRIEGLGAEEVRRLLGI